MTVSKDFAERIELARRLVHAQDERDAARAALKRSQRINMVSAALFLVVAVLNGAHLAGWL